MRAIALSCRPRTAGRRRLRWRLIGMVLINAALWCGLITLAWTLTR